MGDDEYLQNHLGILPATMAIMGTESPPPMIIPRPARVLAQWSHKVVRWHQSPFSPNKDLSLYHWTSCIDRDSDRFSAFNHGVPDDPASYTAAQYAQFLETPDWTKHDTDHLFDLVRTYNGRFPVIHDRYDPPSGIPRDMESLKSRYATVLKQLHSTATPNSPQFLELLNDFDPDSERERKRHVHQLMTRTAAQINEEAQYHALLLDFEAHLPLIQSERTQVLTRFFKGQDPCDMASYNLRRALHKEDTSKRSVETHITVDGIFEYPPEFRLVPGVSLRSQSGRITVRSNMQQKVGTLISQFGIRPATHPMMSTARTMAKFDELKASIVQLVELRRQADKLESELRSRRLHGVSSHSGTFMSSSGTGNPLSTPSGDRTLIDLSAVEDKSSATLSDRKRGRRNIN